uniref:Peroxisomal biogenesis factor 3 n=1 Tax=Tabanus bromius TaxID=304241 RepID=A0A0K8TT58_TABBR
MFSGVKNFISRHKRKFLVTGAIIGGTVITVRYAQRKLREFQEAQTRAFIEKTKRMQHFESTERTCNQAILGLSPSLGDEILKILNSEEILEKLRKNPENKIELWEKLKILSFTRLTAFIYASSILVVTLRVQLNLLGGYLYKDTVTGEAKITDDIRQAYLSLIQHFLKDGINHLVKLIDEKVRMILKKYTLDQKIGLSEVENIFWSIQLAVNSDAKDPNSKMAHYVLPTEVNETGVLSKMFLETLDMLESDDVAILCSNNVSRGFSIAVDSIAEFYTENVKANGALANFTDKPATSKLELNEIYNINSVALHLAKLIPILNGITSKSFDSNSKPPNLATSLITLFLVSDKVKILGANVYEVFSV